MALIESRLEMEKQYEDPQFGLKELADMIGTSQSRILDLFRKSMQYKTLEDYLDYLRILDSMYYLMARRDWNVAACAQQSGFSAIRSFNRKFQDALGMTPHEFRILIDSHPTPRNNRKKLNRQELSSEHKIEKGPAQTDRSLSLCKSDIYSSTAACAAARRAMGTRNGEQDA